MSGIFTSGLLFCVEVAFEHIHTSVKSTVHWKRSRLGAALLKTGEEQVEGELQLGLPQGP